jgi:hypothetical protein
MFILAVEVFDYLHLQVNGFFHQNMACGVKGTKSPPLSILHPFL